MPRKATWAVIFWVVLGVVGYVELVPADPDCVADPTAELCDRLAAVGMGVVVLFVALVWLVAMIALVAGWVATRPKRPKVA